MSVCVRALEADAACRHTHTHTHAHIYTSTHTSTRIYTRTHTHGCGPVEVESVNSVGGFGTAAANVNPNGEPDEVNTRGEAEGILGERVAAWPAA